MNRHVYQVSPLPGVHNFNPARERVGIAILTSGPNNILPFIAMKTTGTLALFVCVCSSQSVGILRARMVSDWHMKLPIVSFCCCSLCPFSTLGE